MHAADRLQLHTNPFTASASGARIGRPLQAALGEVIRQIGLEAPVVVVCGSAGTGKTLLAIGAAIDHTRNLLPQTAVKAPEDEGKEERLTRRQREQLSSLVPRWT